jgi:hypothetical protein
MELREVTDSNLEGFAKKLTEHDKNFHESIQSTLISLGQDGAETAESKAFEWCLLEHARLGAVWIDRFHRKTFKSPSLKQWLPVILTQYTRANRLSGMSRLYRQQYTVGHVFPNLVRASKIASHYDALTSLVQPPYGDGQETVLGSLILTTLLYYLPQPLDNKVLSEVNSWLIKHLKRTHVSPQKTASALLWVLDFQVLDLPERVDAYYLEKNETVWFLDVAPLIPVVRELGIAAMKAVNETILRPPELVERFKIAQKIKIKEVDAELSLKHQLPEGEGGITYHASEISEKDIQLLTNEHYRQFRMNQIFLIEHPLTRSLLMASLKQIDNTPQGTELDLDWVGCQLEEVSLTIKETQLNAIWLYSLDRNHNYLFSKHINFFPGQWVDVLFKTGPQKVKLENISELYPKYQLISVSRETKN